jgi:GT2 family glycosyltransferase
MTEKIDIIMVCRNHWDLTQKTLESLAKYTDSNDYHLIIIDNASSDETQFGIIKFIDDNPTLSLELIRNEENLGFIKPINEVCKRLDKKYFLTCHNDILFSENWLPEMIKRFDNEKIAMAGATSDFILGLQHVNFNMKGIVSESSKFICGLFCLFRTSAVKQLIEKDGYFMDEIFGLGDKEEIDYAIRLTNLGYEFKIVRSVFIHHEGEKAFADAFGGKEGFYSHQDKNYELLINKWGKEKVEELYKIDMIKRLSICIGIPTRTDYYHREFAKSIWFIPKIGSWQIVDVSRSIISEAREMIAEKALELGCEWLLFIDDDSSFQPKALEQLLSHDVDIVSGLVFQRKPPYYPCIFKLDDKNDLYMTECIDKGLIEIDATGMAFTLIKTKIFKSIPKPWFVWGDKTLGIYVDKGGLGEDLSFCIKAKRAGFKVYCDTDINITHIGESQMVNKNTYLDYKNKQEKENVN